MYIGSMIVLKEWNGQTEREGHGYLYLTRNDRPVFPENGYFLKEKIVSNRTSKRKIPHGHLNSFDLGRLISYTTTMYRTSKRKILHDHFNSFDLGRLISYTTTTYRTSKRKILHGHFNSFDLGHVISLTTCQTKKNISRSVVFLND